MRFEALIKPLQPVKIVGGEVEILSIVDDSREVVEGACFAVMQGYKTDGRRFISMAEAKGARAYLLEDEKDAPTGSAFAVFPDVRAVLSKIASRFYADPSKAMKVVGITGTNGKTSTTYLAEAMFEKNGFKTGVIGTVNYRYMGLEFPAPTTTPGPIALQRMLKDMADAGVQVVLMEVSSHALEQYRADGVSFDAALFTNLTRDHLDFHETMQAYLEAKRRLFVPLLEESESEMGGVAIVNADTPESKRMVEGLTKKVLRFSASGDERAEIYATDIALTIHGTQATIHYPGGETTLQTPMLGRHNLSNAMQAFAIGLALKLNPKEAAAAIGACELIPGRLEKVNDPQNKRHLFVDYCHTPDALENALAILRRFKKTRLIVVFGCGGDRDRGKRPLMGKAAATQADVVVLTSDNPRTEDPFAILSDIETGVIAEGFTREEAPDALKEKTYLVIEDRAEAIETAVRLSGEGDIFLIAGKGHEDYIIRGETKSHFSDREEGEKALQAMAKNEERKA